MKKIHSVAFVLFIATALSFTTKFSDIQNTITATFIEITNDDFFKFIDADKKEILFYDVIEEVEISLYDDENLNKKFTITWVEKEIELMDEEGDLTGEKKKVKSITSLTLVN
ncbi:MULTISPECIES: hypothetical protein [Polaribacter]|uniref:Uncharacterized protein n=1 Tax=Polaribacter marinaquae TaxID=1642819 RepID=A0ABZ2TNF6_9FLAO|nr:hypothetical protein [Polaribacter sp. KT 15]SHM92791.1 hypothetical protein SAMN05720268_1455 [Polaribacter sp. KT 15]